MAGGPATTIGKKEIRGEKFGRKSPPTHHPLPDISLAGPIMWIFLDKHHGNDLKYLEMD